MGNDRTILGYGRFEPDFTMCNCLMSFVEVEVDIETGKVSLLRVVNATDIGQIIDPLGLEGQLNGCWGSAGIDSAIFEETILDRRTGHIVNANLIDYKWRTFANCPSLKMLMLETPFPSHRFHAVGIAEITTAPGPSAALMAASNAIGDMVVSIPCDSRSGAQGPLERSRTMKTFKHHNARSLKQAASLLSQIQRESQGQCRRHGSCSAICEIVALPDYPEALINIKTIPES